MKPILDIFSGPGGSGTGFELGGFSVVEAIDNSSIACQTYQVNHKDTKVVCDDIRNHSYSKGDYEGVISGVVAGPPCQDFSIMNLKRHEDSQRANLIYEFIRVCEEVKPLFALLENVYSVPLKIKSLVIKALVDLGYKVISRVIDCSNFGCVQTRRRWLTVATKVRHIFPDPIPGIRKAREILTGADSEIVPRPETLREIQKLPMGKWAAISGQQFKVYYVVDPDKPLPAVVNPTKLRYIRPDRSGYLSMKELYKAQGFPDNYIWLGTLTEKGQMLANAFPCEAAEAFAKALITLEE